MLFRLLILLILTKSGQDWLRLLLWLLTHHTAVLIVVQIAQSDAVLAVPLVQLVDLLLGHLKQVCCAFRMEPATVNAIVLTLTHHETPSL